MARFMTAALAPATIRALASPGGARARAPVCAGYADGEAAAPCGGGFSDGAPTDGVAMRVRDASSATRVDSKVDANGAFAFAIPGAGLRGFAAPGVGPDKTLDGKAPSHDAMIRARADAMK